MRWISGNPDAARYAERLSNEIIMQDTKVYLDLECMSQDREVNRLEAFWKNDRP